MPLEEDTVVREEMKTIFCGSAILKPLNFLHGVEDLFHIVEKIMHNYMNIRLHNLNDV